jgi:hypothetical protein
VSHAGDQRSRDAQSSAVPGWLRPPPPGIPKHLWRPMAMLAASPVVRFTYDLVAPCEEQLAHLATTLERMVKGQRKTKFQAALPPLPIWEQWCKDVPGISAYGLALLIAELGDLWEYPGVAKVWKRMGVGLHNGERQRCKAGITEEEARAMAYSPKRRSRMYNVEIGLRNQNKDADGAPGIYRALYDGRKVYEATQAPSLSKAAWARRACRYAGKRFLRDFWVAWRQTMPRSEGRYWWEDEASALQAVAD